MSNSLYANDLDINGLLAGFELVTIIMLVILLWRGSEAHGKSFVPALPRCNRFTSFRIECLQARSCG